jgi:hypothetical protein
MKKGQWSSTKAMGNYLHSNDAGQAQGAAEAHREARA